MPKDDVRKLFKKQQAERNKAAKVKHPFAKYDEVGRLLCIVCQSPVKAENVWQAHLGSALHLDNIKKLKALKQQQQQQQQQQQLKRRAPSPTTQTDDQSEEEEEEIEHKRIRLDSSSTQPVEKQNIELDEEPSDNEDANVDEDSTAQLPADFFDEEPEENAENDPMDEEPTDVVEPNTVPAGFFDDPEEDARVRGALLPEEQAKVDLEKNLQEFNEAMVDVTQESRQAQEEDDEAFWQERHYELTMEQAAFDSRVQKLKQLRDLGAPLGKDTTTTTEQEGEGKDDIHVKLKSNIRQVLKKQPEKKMDSVFDDDLELSSEEEEEEDWRAQQL